MAVVKRDRKNGVSYQVKVIGGDGRFISRTFERKLDADRFDAEMKLHKRSGLAISNRASQMTLTEYFWFWHEETKNGRVSIGWRNDQIRYFERFVDPVIGNLRLHVISPGHIQRVLTSMKALGLGEQMRLHVFNLLHKMFCDAIEDFPLGLFTSPVKRKLRPKMPKKQARYLRHEEVDRLLLVIAGTAIEAAVRLQLYLGLRAGEVQALKWADIDFDEGRIRKAGTYVRKEKRFKDVPKDGEQQWLPTPVELLEFLRDRRQVCDSEWVAGQRGLPLNYFGYCKSLRVLCKRESIPWVGTHGLRHTCSEIYLRYGAQRDDLKMLYGHSTTQVTERYMHDRESRLERFTNVIRLMPRKEVSQNLPKSGEVGSDTENRSS